MSYLLDTDIVSNPLKRRPSLALLKRLAVVPPEEQFTTVITVGEMIYGALRSQRAQMLIDRLDRDVWPNHRILDFDLQAAREYGRLRAHSETQGVSVAEADLRIAAIAATRGLVVVTGNTRHFERVPGLTVVLPGAEDLQRGHRHDGMKG